jgi:hypothetical protein
MRPDLEYCEFSIKLSDALLLTASLLAKSCNKKAADKAMKDPNFDPKTITKFFTLTVEEASRKACDQLGIPSMYYPIMALMANAEANRIMSWAQDVQRLKSDHPTLQ